MHQSECLAKGGFKINGPPKMGKGPMVNEEDQEPATKPPCPNPPRQGG